MTSLVSAQEHSHGGPHALLPEPRGELTQCLFTSLSAAPHELAEPALWDLSGDEEDLQLALYCCYELHYQGFRDVAAAWEWEPSLLALRRRLETRFLEIVRELVGPVDAHPETVVPRLWEMATHGGGPSLSGWVAERATVDHLRELAVHRSAYQLKEADPHTWAIPRLSGGAKAAMVAIQADEYGNGVAARMHASLFAQTMTALGLDPRGAYLDRIPGVTLATTNLISLFGLHRRWRAALVGHLALFEMTSVGPMARYAQALRRLGVPEAGCAFYDVHVDADQVHQHVAADDMVGALLRLEPDLASDVVFGATALTAVEARFARHVLDRWTAGCSSLAGAGALPVVGLCGPLTLPLTGGGGRSTVEVSPPGEHVGRNVDAKSVRVA